MSERKPLAVQAEDTSWSSSSALILGILALGRPAEKRLLLHLSPAWVLLLLWCCWVGWPAHLQAPGWQKLIAALLPGATFLFMLYEWRQYLRRLDELERKLYFESFAWTYLSALVAWAFLFGLCVTQGWTLEPIGYWWFIFLEGVRAIVLFRLARRYR